MSTGQSYGQSCANTEFMTSPDYEKQLKESCTVCEQDCLGVTCPLFLVYGFRFTNNLIVGDLEWEFVDGSIVKAHQHSTGAASDGDEAIGKSVAGNTTKIHMATDAHGLPIDFEITGGEVLMHKKQILR
jgi:hypothetical protein